MSADSSPGFFARRKLASPATSVSKDPDALRIGILGAANIAPQVLVYPAKSMRSVVIASVAARDQTKAKEFADRHGIPTTHVSYDALISDPAIDCIYNPLPNGLHYEWTKKALEAGKHVLLEKPATSNATQAKELFALAKDKNLVLLEAFHYRFHPASIHFRQLLQKHIADGHPLTSVRAIFPIPAMFSLSDIRFNYKLAGGTMMDCGCYAVNAVRHYTGLEVDSVQEAKPKIISEDIDGRMDAVLNMKGNHSGGVQAVIAASLTNPWLSLQTYKELPPRFEAETDDKIFTFGLFVLAGFYHYITIKDKAKGTSETQKVYGEGYMTYRYQLEAFVKAVKGGGKDTESIAGWVTGEDSIANMTAIDAIYTAAGMKIRE
ncbi:hypothetical protein BGZ70_008462 [Mortierella alpina]|uniref:D-xylose 1-dehydrogenase (NADP(+), D-xylono-1,5-lactone-forming) n=1 Tax=Mortierella alpina TaxID=64518 RepID=A0A9P6JE09_MORAP|nr:hypothetical protein BGZ70_008462 [Mortierella alpina]